MKGRGTEREDEKRRLLAFEMVFENEMVLFSTRLPFELARALTKRLSTSFASYNSDFCDW